MHDLIERAIAIIETEREALFAAHQVGGVITVEDDTDQVAADAIAEMDAWLREARPALGIEAGAHGWIVGSGDGRQWRTWADGSPAWTDNPKLATRFARREDAEAVHAEDEDAWTVVTFSSTLIPKKHVC